MVCPRDDERMSVLKKIAENKMTPSTHISKHVVEVAKLAAELAAS